MANVNTVLSRLISALTVSDSTWDVSVGSTTYKILESVANEIAIAANKSTLQSYSYNPINKSGTELDAFVNLFGISRQLGKRSYGSVTFSVSAPATSIVNIPAGTQIYVPSTSSATGANIFFSTTVNGTIGLGQTQITIPVMSTLVGSQGNVAIGTITQVQTSLIATPSVTNYQALFGGTDTETDGQLQNRWFNTSFSNISGTIDKFSSMALQNPNVTQVNVVGAQQTYLEQLQVITTISGNGTLQVGFGSQAQLVVGSGSTTASLYQGTIPKNITIPSGNITTLPASGVYTGTVYYDGTNYILSTAATASGNLIVNYLNYSSTVLSGASTPANVVTALSGLLPALGFNNQTQVLIQSGTSISGNGGIALTLSQPINLNVVISGATASGTNTITSQIPDSKFTYPQGGELVGSNIGSINQQLLTNAQDYIYPTSSGVPLIITLKPTAANANLTYTGDFLQLQSEYIPVSSRITNPTINSNFVDVFINSASSSSINEQIIFQPTLVFTSGTGKVTDSSNFAFANGINCISGTYPNPGDYYIPLVQQPVINFPNQLVSGNAPSYMTFGTANAGNTVIPISVDYLNPPLVPATITGVSGLVGSNLLYTTASISGLITGLVASGTGYKADGTAMVSTTLSGLPFANFITQLVPGTPNIIVMNQALTSNVAPSFITFVTVGYPVYDVTNTAGSVQGLTGIAVDSNEQVGYRTANVPPFVSPPVSMLGSITHLYNSDVNQVDNLIQQSRVVGTNVLTHQTQFLNLIVNLSIVYEQNANVTATNNDIQSTLSQFLQTISYNGIISLSNISNSVLSVTGVKSARISTSTDNPVYYGIQTVNIDGSINRTYTGDILLSNNQLPSLYSVNFTAFGVNNF